MTRRVVLASGNRGKLREIREMLAGLDFEIASQAEFGVADVPETGLSFVENALIKARHVAEVSGLPAIADDSGLVVDALGGAPGIYSARYAGVGASDRANLEKLLEAMQGVPEVERSARFYCAMVWVEHAGDPTPVISEGAWEGRLLSSPRGAGGFGYDPVFYAPEHGCSSAELEPAVKNASSHRGQALRGLLERLRARR